MKHVKQLILAAAVALWLMPAAQADVSSQGGHVGPKTDPLNTFTVTADTANVNSFAAGTPIYGFKITATTGPGYCTLYDTTVSGGNTNANLIEEWGEATTGDSGAQIWPKPYVLIRGLTIDVTTANCTVYY